MAAMHMTDWDRDAALTTARILLEIKAINVRPEEPYTFTSGWKSPVYIDCRKIIYFPRARSKICELAVEKIGRHVGYETIEAVARELAPVAPGVRIRAFSPTPLLEVSGDAGRLKQVVLNLVQNAINAGSSDINVSLLREGDRARLEVLDNGPGIPEAAIPNLFERFYRVDGARSTRGNGSGLGLAIVKWIVEQHGGAVEVESKVGEGTVFTVFLPVLSGSGQKKA